MKKYNCNCGGAATNVCSLPPTKITLRTVVLPPSLGTDEAGQPYAPALGKWYNSVVVYQANGAIYIYDSKGQYTEVEPGDYEQLVSQVDSYAAQLAELYSPGTIGLIVRTEADLDTLAPNAVPADQYVLVEADSTHDNRPSLYEYSPSAGSFVYAMAASPYYEKPFIDSVTSALQTNINNVMNKEITDVENLQTNINHEVNTREQADTKINQRIDDIINSPDVRYIVDTYAELEAIDKGTIGDLDYARVLQDETHESASTYYQFHTSAQEWTYIGQTGPYYTKEQIDDMIGDINSILDSINGETPSEGDNEEENND